MERSPDDLFIDLTQWKQKVQGKITGFTHVWWWLATGSWLNTTINLFGLVFLWIILLLIIMANNGTVFLNKIKQSTSFQIHNMVGGVPINFLCGPTNFRFMRPNLSLNSSLLSKGVFLLVFLPPTYHQAIASVPRSPSLFCVLVILFPTRRHFLPDDSLWDLLSARTKLIWLMGQTLSICWKNGADWIQSLQTKAGKFTQRRCRFVDSLMFWRGYWSRQPVDAEFALVIPKWPFSFCTCEFVSLYPSVLLPES